MTNCDHITILLTVFGILYIAFIVSAYRVMKRFDKQDIIKEQDKPMTDFGTKSETKP